MTSILVHCSKCGARIRIKGHRETAGKQVCCPRCSQMLVVPPLAGLSKRPSEPSEPLEFQDSLSQQIVRLKETETQVRKEIVRWKIAAGIILLVLASGLIWLVQPRVRQESQRDVAESATRKAEERPSSIPTPPPLRLVAGKPLPGNCFAFFKVHIEGNGYSMDYGRETRFGAMRPAAASAECALATTSGFQIGLKRQSQQFRHRRIGDIGDLTTIPDPPQIGGLKQDQVDYEIRPKGTGRLKLDALVTDNTWFNGFKEKNVQAYLWKEQPYEILNRKLEVVYSHPASNELGAQRKQLAEVGDKQ